MKTIRLSLLLTFVPTAAFAHTGHFTDGTFAAGLLHPLLGIDHLTAMIAVGVWAQLVAPNRVWVWPATFVIAMLAGSLVAGFGFEIHGIETLILLSLFAVGLAIFLNAAAPIVLGGLGTALFALAHGYAHGAEAPAGSVASYMTGFSVATALLHVAGIALAWAFSHLPVPLTARALGLIPIAVGVALAAR